MKHDEIKICEGSKEDFEKEHNRLSEEGYIPCSETHRVYEYIGKIYYSVVMVKYGDDIILVKNGKKDK